MDLQDSFTFSFLDICGETLTVVLQIGLLPENTNKVSPKHFTTFPNIYLQVMQILCNNLGGILKITLSITMTTSEVIHYVVSKAGIKLRHFHEKSWYPDIIFKISKRFEAYRFRLNPPSSKQIKSITKARKYSYLMNLFYLSATQTYSILSSTNYYYHCYHLLLF